jgi:HAD superfamily hydrolase (TIGR01509 family)
VSTSLEAVIFDVDGTLAETEREGHRVAFNRAFQRMGLEDRWSTELYGELLRVAGGKERILHYFLERRSGPPPENAEEFAAELHRSKVDEFQELLESGELAPRPGVLRLFSELDEEKIARAVATTGTRSAVLTLLEGLDNGGKEGFAAILTAEEAPVKKPDPQVYNLALEELGISASEALAVEDSLNGLVAAVAAGLPCLVTVSEYNVGEDFSEANLVVESLGEPGEPAKVLYDPHDVVEDEMVVVDSRLLQELHQRSLSKRL